MGGMRFRPRFSLRTLFVLVTLAGIACAWVAYQLDWIRQRKAVLQNVRYAGPAQYLLNPRPHTGVPFYRKWLGDVETQRIDAWSLADADRANALFPELQQLFYVDGMRIINYDGDRMIPVQGGPSRPPH